MKIDLIYTSEITFSDDSVYTKIYPSPEMSIGPSRPVLRCLPLSVYFLFPQRLAAETDRDASVEEPVENGVHHILGFEAIVPFVVVVLPQNKQLVARPREL